MKRNKQATHNYLWPRVFNPKRKAFQEEIFCAHVSGNFLFPVIARGAAINEKCTLPENICVGGAGWWRMEDEAAAFPLLKVLSCCLLAATTNFRGRLFDTFVMRLTKEFLMKL